MLPQPHPPHARLDPLVERRAYRHHRTVPLQPAVKSNVVGADGPHLHAAVTAPTPHLHGLLVVVDAEECVEDTALLEEALAVHPPAVGGVETHGKLVDEDRVLLVPHHQDPLLLEVRDADHGAMIGVLCEQGGDGVPSGQIDAENMPGVTTDDNVICSNKTYRCGFSFHQQYRLRKNRDTLHKMV